MQRHTVNNLTYYTFDSLRDSGNVIHAISTRHGGVSPAPFDTLNLSQAAGDTAANVVKNIEHLHNALALESAAVTASQAQADRIAVVNASHHGRRVQNVDALLTDKPGVPLMLCYADCVPIFLYDPMHRAIGVVHAGWRGTVSKIAAKSARAMGDAFGTRPRDLVACIGPSIGPCCYRIGDDVIERVRAALDDADQVLVAQPSGAKHFDLWQANAEQLREMGVEQIEIAEICTADHTDEFYSWRAENKVTGRFGAVIAMV